MIKLVFWDRDGAINIGRPPAAESATLEETSRMYVLSRDQFKLVPTAKKAVIRLKNLGILQVVVTKQRCVERGLITVKGLADLHEYMQKQLGIRFDEIKVQMNKIKGQSKNALIIEATQRFNINPDECALIGDRASDMEVGVLAKIPVRILVTWQSERDKLADDLEEAKTNATHIVNLPLEAAELVVRLNQK